MFLVVLVAVLAAVLVLAAFVELRRVRRRSAEAPPVPPEAPPAPSVEAPVTDVHDLEAPADSPAPVSPAEAAQVEIARPGLAERLGKARAFLGDSLAELRLRRAVDDGTWDGLEEALIRADVGVATTAGLLDALRERAKDEGITDADGLLAALRGLVEEDLGTRPRRLDAAGDPPTVWLFVGVNGTGKTTTIGKLARREVADGRSVLLVAADTFRAAAAEQLGTWAERAGADLIRGQEGADPGSVVFDGMHAASGRGSDLVLVDTAGRLHTKANLMDELSKLKRIVERTPGALQEVLLVIDATTGQNGLAQARQFGEAVDVSGVILTKLDGTAKGGIVLAIQHELGIPVKLVGIGEGPDDLVEFDPREFSEALFS